MSPPGIPIKLTDNVHSLIISTNEVSCLLFLLLKEKKLSCIIITFRLHTYVFKNSSQFDNKLLPIKIGYERLLYLSFSETLMMLKFILLIYYFDEILCELIFQLLDFG